MDVRSAAQTDHARSVAILIGVADADHTDHELRPVPATLNSLRAMQRVLTDPNLCGWPGDRVTVLRNPDNAGPTARRLRDLTRSARDTLLVYYAGEASLTTGGLLCLALHDTKADAPDRTGLSYSWLARTLRDSPARRKVVILDCCLPGRTGQFLDPVSDQIAELSDVEGVYTLTSTTRHHPAPVVNALQQRPRPTVFTGQLVELVEGGLPGGPHHLTFEDLYPALRQRLVSMGLPPPNQRGTGATRPLLLARNVAPRSASAAAAATPTASPPSPPSLQASGSAPAPAPGRSPTAAGPVLGIAPEVGPALLPGPDPAPMLTAGPAAPALLTGPPGNGARHNGHGPTTGPTPAVGFRPITGQTPVVGARPITGQTPVLGARPLAGPEPPRRTPGSDGTPPPPPPTATPLPGPPGPSGAPGSAPPGGSGESREAGPSSRPAPSPAAQGAGRPPTDDDVDGIDDPGESPGGDPTTRQRRSRRMWALALAAALLVPTLYVIRPSGKGGSSDSRDGRVEVDLRDVGNRTISLDKGIQPISLLQDDDTLWVQAGSGGSSAELTKIDLATGEVVDSLPFPESDIVGTVTAGAGSLWVTTSSAENMSGAVVRIDPDTGEEIATIPLPAWPGRAVFADGSLWVATVVQPVAEELGATPAAMSSAANGLRRIDPETNELVTSIPLEATPLDVRAADGLVLVSTESSEKAAVVAIDPVAEDEVARILVPEGASAEVDPDGAGPWMVFAADPYAVRVDVEAEAVAAVTGPRDGIDMLVPNGDQMWELRAEVLTVLDEKGDEVVTVTIDGTPLAAAPAGRGAVWIAYRPPDDDEVLVTRVPAAELVERSDD